ncbi:uncharacterized protein LOC122315931 isoform X3 [Carya illinoinensis]|uniref:uncharacterized protein LOC122315931 isoform X3 n=1 Tax=Carya illinoinensis TaxID=32201 RepID=UPI001C71C5D0|nr:uncharacterized protein LOC122315931 isoform X3 [Carya illinoinensis]
MGFKLDPWVLGPIIRFIISGSFFPSSTWRAKQRLKATMPSRKKASKKHATISKASLFLLKSKSTEIESARLRDGNSLPEKQQFSIGVIDVTRALERMPPIARVRSSPQQPHSICSNHKAPLDQLQVVLLASDRWLMKHLPIMASSRRVPLIHVKDKKGGSLRLGELFRLRTAMAIGVKAKGNASNQLFEKILHGDEINHGTNCIDTIAMPDGPCQ